VVDMQLAGGVKRGEEKSMVFLCVAAKRWSHGCGTGEHCALHVLCVLRTLSILFEEVVVAFC
jgi:hypothetical protein